MIKATDSSVMVTGEHIEWFRLNTIASGLALEISTGMKAGNSRQSLVKVVNGITGGNARRKVQALADITLYTLVTWEGHKVAPSVRRALEANGWDVEDIAAQVPAIREQLAALAQTENGS